MAIIDDMSDEEFQRHALEILSRELGLNGLVRFIRLNRAGKGDYTRDRHIWLDSTTIQEIMAEIESQPAS